MNPHRLKPAERKAKRQKAKHANRFPEIDGKVLVETARLAPLGSWNHFPDFYTRGYYEDAPFTCQNCGKTEVWTASQQKWWFEIAKGAPFTVASRCRACRRRERERRNEARRVHLEGLTAKHGWSSFGVPAPSGVRIELLKHRPEFIPIVATCHHLEWGHLRPGDTVEARIARLEASCCSEKEPPAIFIALKHGLFAGSAMLVPHDIEERRELTPWLGGVFTAPRFRRQGIASALSRQVVQHAAMLGFRRLYLYTFGSPHFYERLGWSTFERASHLGCEVTIMSHEAPDARAR